MTWLTLGVLLWSAVHLMPSVGIAVKTMLVERLGDALYRGAFAVLIVGALTLIVIGWRSTPELPVYDTPPWIRPVGFVLMIVSFVLFGAAKQPTRIKLFIRHPQLTGVIVWAISHLLMNGSARAIVLFGGLGLWALIEIPLINAREGVWTKPAAPSIGVELRGLAISIVIFIVALVLHPYFAGVAPSLP